MPTESWDRETRRRPDRAPGGRRWGAAASVRPGAVTEEVLADSLARVDGLLELLMRLSVYAPVMTGSAANCAIAVGAGVSHTG